jgi:hypothetical protein
VVAEDVRRIAPVLWRGYLGVLDRGRAQKRPESLEGVSTPARCCLGYCGRVFLRTAEMRCPFLPNLTRALRTFSVNARPSWMLGATNRRTVCFMTFLLVAQLLPFSNRGGNRGVTPPRTLRLEA